MTHPLREPVSSLPVGRGDRATPPQPPPRFARVTGAVAGAVMVTLLFVGSGGREATTTDPAAADPISWTWVPIPEASIRPESLLAGPYGFAMLAAPSGSGATLWFSSDGLTWSGSDLDEIPFGVVAHGDDLIAFREYRGIGLSRDGDRWEEVTSLDLPTYARSGYLSARPAVVTFERGVLVHSVEGELFHSPDGVDFEQVIEPGEWWSPSQDLWQRFTAPARPTGCLPPTKGSPDYPPLLETPQGLIALVPREKSGLNLTWPVCDPELWLSPDGSQWSPAIGTSGFEPGSFVYEVAGRSGWYVAVGGRGAGEPAVWVSDDGLAWSRLAWPALDDGSALVDVTAGDAGFLILSRAASGRRGPAWFSPDGQCWRRLPGYVGGVAGAVGVDRLLLIDRLGLPRLSVELWVGIVNHAAQDGCEPSG